MNTPIAYPKFRWFVAFAICAGSFSFGILCMCFAPVFPELAKEYGTSIGSLVALLISTNIIAAGIGTMASGPFMDKWGPRKVLLLSCILMALSTAAIPFAGHAMATLVVIRILQGFFGGPVTGTLSSIAARWFPANEYGTFTGLPTMVTAIAFFLNFRVIPTLMPMFHGDWRKLMGAIAIIPAVSAVVAVIALMKSEPVVAAVPSHAAAQAATGASNLFAIALKQPAFWFTVVVWTLCMLIASTFNSLGPSYFRLAVGMSPVVAGKAMSYAQIGWIFSGLSLGFMLPRIFKGSVRGLLIFDSFVGGAAVFSVCLPVVHNRFVVLAAVMLIFGWILRQVSPAIPVYVAQNYPPQILGKVFSATAGASLLISSIGAAACGALLNATKSFTAVFVAFLIMTVVMGLCCMMMTPITAFQKAKASAATVRD